MKKRVAETGAAARSLGIEDPRADGRRRGRADHEAKAQGTAPARTNNLATLDALLESSLIKIRRGSLLSQMPDATPRPWERVEGMMLGLAIGDSLGNTSESITPQERRARHGEVRDYRPNRKADAREVGVPSDDSQLAFWTLEQSLSDGGLVPEALARRFCAERIFGIGSTVKMFIRNFRDSGRAWHEAGAESAGNGALMRIAPTLVPHLRQPDTGLWADTALSAMMTHNDTASISSCLAFTAMLWELLAASDAPPAAWWIDRFVSVARDFELPGKTYKARGGKFAGTTTRFTDFVEERLHDAKNRGLNTLAACEEWHSGAFLLETVPCALYILMLHAANPEEAIVRAVNDTRANDTVAAIVGAAVGALHGTAGLPLRWREGLLGRTGATDDGRVFELLAQARARFGVETANIADDHD